MPLRRAGGALQSKPTSGKAALGLGALALGAGAASLLIFQQVETVLQARSQCFTASTPCM